MAAAKHRRLNDRHDSVDAVRIDCAPIEGVLASSFDWLAISHNSNPHCNSLHPKSSAGCLWYGARNMGISPIHNDIYFGAAGTSQSDASLIAGLLGRAHNSAAIEALLQYFDDLPRLLLANCAERAQATSR